MGSKGKIKRGKHRESWKYGVKTSMMERRLTGEDVRKSLWNEGKPQYSEIFLNKKSSNLFNITFLQPFR